MDANATLAVVTPEAVAQLTDEELELSDEDLAIMAQATEIGQRLTMKK